MTIRIVQSCELSVVDGFEKTLTKSFSESTSLIHPSTLYFVLALQSSTAAPFAQCQEYAQKTDKRYRKIFICCIEPIELVTATRNTKTSALGELTYETLSRKDSAANAHVTIIGHTYTEDDMHSQSYQLNRHTFFTSLI